MNIITVLESLQREVAESKPLPWPLQEKSVIDRERLIRILDRTRESLPEEVKQARWISKETDRIAAESSTRADRVVREAQSKGREILRAAEDEVLRLLSKEEILVRARVEAQRTLEEARQESRRLREEAARYARETRQDADRYALKVLNGMEGELSRVLTIIKRGQESLLSQEGQP
jgi:hypothetical protein